ncbi:hypothetical protein [Paraburkholderia rhizosphaerae]|nr:hypothetical protein [Paraburkholderia rhizosphaerae]
MVIGMLRDAGYDADSVKEGRSSKVDYMTPEQREQYRVIPNNGLLCKREGDQLRPLTTKPIEDPDAFDFDDAEPAQATSRHMYVMDEQGQLFMGHERVVSHHSAFLAGAPVAAAGEMTVTDGRVEYVNDKSGHYQPTLEHTQQLEVELKMHGVDLPVAQKEPFGKTKEELKRIGISFERYYPDHPDLFKRKPY